MKLLHGLGLAGIAALALPLSACKQEATDQGTGPQAQSTAPDAKPGLAVESAKLLLPAVKGNPGVVYFTVRNSGKDATAITAVHVGGAGRAEMHETRDGKMAPVTQVELEPGTEVKFAPGGLHVMVFDLDQTVAAGGTVEMTVTFAGGDKATVPVAIASRGSAHDMGGMASGAAH